MEEITLVRAKKYPTLSELEHSDWRYEFPKVTRRWICYHIENLFRQHFTGCLLQHVLPGIAKEFEERIFYSMAESEADYLRKIIFKLFDILGYLEPTFTDDQMENFSSTQSANQINPDNSATCTGTHYQVLDWKAETLEKINYLVRTYGNMFWDVYYWAKNGPENRGGTNREQLLLEDYISELDLIANIFLLITQKESISIELKEYIKYIKYRIFPYIDLKVSSDSTDEIYSKLETSSPDINQKSHLNELIKAFLLDKAKELGVYNHLVDDDGVDNILAYYLHLEIVEIINRWCDHKIRILTRAWPTMQDIENELSIWQTPGSKLQQWCLLKHLPLKVGPGRQRPDPLLEKVRSIWKMRDNELQQPSPFQQHLQQQVDPARQPAVPVPQQVGPTKKGPDATLLKARLIQHFREMMKPLATCPVLQQSLPMPQETRLAFSQLQDYSGSPLQRTGAAQTHPVVVPVQRKPV